MLKLDPYINVDPGTMSPYPSTVKCSFTHDGAETDLDLGHTSVSSVPHEPRTQLSPRPCVRRSACLQEARG